MQFLYIYVNNLYLNKLNKFYNLNIYIFYIIKINLVLL